MFSLRLFITSFSLFITSFEILLFITLQCEAKQYVSLSSQPVIPLPTSSHNPAFLGCERNLLPPATSDSLITKYVIDLGLPPTERWTQVVQDKKSEILALLASVRENSDEWFGQEVFTLVDEYLPSLARTLPATFYEELEGIATAINVTLGEVTLFNVFYEFFSVCTSIVVQTSDGQIFHARNLDFGIFLGWDIANKTWLITERLRPLTIELDFQREGQTVYKAVSFAGFLGVLTGIKPHGFSLTINERFKLNGGLMGVVEWIFGHHNQQWVAFFTRTVMETANSYKEAQKMLAKAPLVSPVYFILAGTKPFQGCIITRGRNKFDIKSLAPAASQFLVQTNYDHWSSPPFYDDRRTPAIHCLGELGLAEPDITLCNVLSTRPVLNKLTVYTTLMHAASGHMLSWLQDCADPCWPW